MNVRSVRADAPKLSNSSGVIPSGSYARRKSGIRRRRSSIRAGSTGTSMRGTGAMPLLLNRTCHGYGSVIETSPPTISVQWRRCR
jgi:hypothetical protein